MFSRLRICIHIGVIVWNLIRNREFTINLIFIVTEEMLNFTNGQQIRIRVTSTYT